MKKVLVTGANGFVGSHLMEIMAENHVEVIAVIRNEQENISSIRQLDNIRYVYCELDEIHKLPDIIPDRDFDCCIHLAWEGSTGLLRGYKELQVRNISRSVELCDAIAKMNIPRFVGIGSLAEKDVNNYIPTDGATPNQVAVYGVAKLTTQYMTKIVCTQNKVEHVWCCLSNLYGAGDTTNNFINMATRLMLTGARPAFTAGEQMYDFVYITDAAKAIYLAADKGKKNTGYYIGSGHQQPLKYFIQEIRDAINPEIELFLGEVPFNGVCLPDSEFDCTKLMEDTGYTPEVLFTDGIRKTIAFLQDHLKK